MEEYSKTRPPKTIFPIEVQKKLREEAIDKIESTFLPDSRIIKIILIGSSVKNSFGEYEAPGFRGSMFSDFDFIFIVADNYDIPGWLNREPTARPFSDNKLNLAFRSKNYIDGKYDCEFFFVRQSNSQNKEIQKLAERAGIPFSNNSYIKHLIVH